MNKRTDGHCVCYTFLFTPDLSIQHHCRSSSFTPRTFLYPAPNHISWLVLIFSLSQGLPIPRIPKLPPTHFHYLYNDFPPWGLQAPPSSQLLEYPYLFPSLLSSLQTCTTMGYFSKELGHLLPQTSGHCSEWL